MLTDCITGASCEIQYEANGPGVGQFPDLVSCSAHGNYFFIQYQCAQYQDHCLKTIMKYWEVPL
eukprot:SAG22_NODE_6870_length_801_cov_1.286325_1_plen_63_part_10